LKSYGFVEIRYGPSQTSVTFHAYDDEEFAPIDTGKTNGLQTQPLIHHRQALPISAVFGLRYVHIFVRKWAALGTCSGCSPQVGMAPVEW
jgi:hypothetical protein